MCVNATQTPVNRSFKARIFEMIFSNKEELLSLYNAVNGTDYKNLDGLLKLICWRMRSIWRCIMYSVCDRILCFII